MQGELVEMEMERRQCANPKCKNMWASTVKDPMIFCSTFCITDEEKKKKLARQEITGSFRHLIQKPKSLGESSIGKTAPKGKETLRVESGLMGRGGVSKESLERKNPRGRPEGWRKDGPNETLKEKNVISGQWEQTPNTEKKLESKAVETITPIKKLEVSKKLSGEEKTQSEPENSGTSGTTETERSKMKKSANGEEGETLPTALNPLSTRLEEERKGSMKQLNDAGEHLLNLAKSLAAPTKVDEEGGVIQRAASHNIEVAVQCLTEFRNVMKIKLEYLKFGKEILEDKSP